MVPWPTQGTSPLWEPGGAQWPKCCGFRNAPHTQNVWRIKKRFPLEANQLNPTQRAVDTVRQSPSLRTGTRRATPQNCKPAGRPLQDKAEARIVKAPQLSGRHPMSGHHATCLSSFPTDVRWNSRTHIAAGCRWPVAWQDVRAPFSGARCLAVFNSLDVLIVSIPTNPLSSKKVATSDDEQAQRPGQVLRSRQSFALPCHLPSHQVVVFLTGPCMPKFLCQQNVAVGGERFGEHGKLAISASCGNGPLESNGIRFGRIPSRVSSSTATHPHSLPDFFLKKKRDPRIDGNIVA